MKKLLSIVISVAMLLTLFASFNAFADGATFTMTDTILELSASEILEKGTVTRDASKFNADGHELAPSSDGKVFWHSGNGDTFTFTVDFGVFQVDLFTFNYGGPVMTLKLYADGELVGEGTTLDTGRDVENHLCKIALSKTLTGVKTIKAEVVSDTTIWPGTDYGYFTFRNSLLVMDAETWVITARDILTVGSVAGDPAKFDRAPREVTASDDRYYFWHSGNGDVYTFDVDFDEYQVNGFSVNYGGPAMTLKVFADGNLIGEAAMEECGRDVDNHVVNIDFADKLTGKHTIKLEVVSDTVVWPGTDFGRVTFNGKIETAPVTEPTTASVTEPTTEPDPVNPHTGDFSVLAIAAVLVFAASIAVVVLKKRKA